MLPVTGDSEGPQMKITARTIAGLKLPGGKNDAIYFDDDMPGFGIRLRVSGAQVRRSWVAQYRSFGRTRRVLLGSAEILGAEQARAAAKKVLARVTLGHDPQAEKATRRQKDTHSLKGIVGDCRPRRHTAFRLTFRFRKTHCREVGQGGEVHRH
jgi:hypothetical protein